MDEEGRSRDRVERRPKRFLTPMRKYEIYLQVIRGEVTMAEAAAAAGVDRTTVMRIRQVAKDGALSALAESRPGINWQSPKGTRPTAATGDRFHRRSAQRQGGCAGHDPHRDEQCSRPRSTRQ